MAAYQSKSESNAYDHLLSEIEHGRLARAYLLHGNESFLIQHLVHLLQDKCLVPAGKDLDGITLQLNGRHANLELQELSEQLRTPPFLSPYRLVMVRESELFANTQNLSDNRYREFCQMIDRIPDSSVLIFWEEKADKRGRGYKYLREHGAVAEINHPDNATLLKWISQYLQQAGIEIPVSVASNLIERCDSDMQLLTHELTKLTLYCGGKKLNKIDAELLERIALPDLQGKIWDMTASLSQGDSAKALHYLNNMRLNADRGDAKRIAMSTLVMLGRNFRQLLCAKQHDKVWLMKALNLKDWQAKRLIDQSKSWHPGVLEQLIDACWSTDMDIKRGRLDEVTALEILVAQAGRAARYSMSMR